MFSYACAYLSKDSQLLFKSLGVLKELHMTTCFDSSATIKASDNIEMGCQSAKIKDICHWNTRNGVYLVAELDCCSWSSKINQHFKNIGAKEDIPHKPHLTLMKSENKDLQNNLKDLVEKMIYFDRHSVRVKDN